MMSARILRLVSEGWLAQTVYLEVPSLPLDHHLLPGGDLPLQFLVGRHPLLALRGEQVPKGGIRVVNEVLDLVYQGRPVQV